MLCWPDFNLGVLFGFLSGVSFCMWWTWPANLGRVTLTVERITGKVRAK